MPTMYDSTTAADLPVVPGAWYAGYIDGGEPSYLAIRRRFPRSRVVSITVDGGDAEVLDVEAGNPTSPAGAVTWVVGRRHLGHRPVIYTNASSIGGLLEAFRLASVHPPFFWVAEWTGAEHTYQGAIATQWGHEGLGTDGHYDVSIVSPDWPDPAPKEKPVISTPTPHLKKQPTASNVRQIAGITALVTAFTGNLPNVAGVNRTAEWVTMTIAGTAIFLVEHFLSDPSTGNPLPPA